jgi:hypothetical protein
VDWEALMGNLLFWLGIGAAQKSTGSKPIASRHPLVSLIVGLVLVLAIVAVLFVLFAYQE